MNELLSGITAEQMRKSIREAENESGDGAQETLPDDELLKKDERRTVTRE